MEAIHQRYILMIEDDADDRYITQVIFEEQGYNVKLEFLTKGEKVIDYLMACPEEYFPSLILLDKNLPAIDGIEVLKTLKQHALYKYIPVIMISGTEAPEIVAESYGHGANSFFQKPDTNQLTKERISAFLKYWFEIVKLPQTRKPTPSIVMN